MLRGITKNEKRRANFRRTPAKEIGKVGLCCAAFGGTAQALLSYPGEGGALRAVFEAVTKSKIRASGPPTKGPAER